MNKNISIKEVWNAFLAYLQQPKTRWDIVEYTRAFVIIFGILALITWLAVVLTAAN